MSAGDSTLRRMREARMQWLEVEPALPADTEGAGTPAKRVRLIRPTEEQMGQGIVRPGGGLGIGYDQVKAYVVDWSGYTQADFLGAAVGSSDPQPFSADLWAEYVADRTALYSLVAKTLLDMCVQHIDGKAQDRKNS